MQEQLTRATSSRHTNSMEEFEGSDIGKIFSDVEKEFAGMNTLLEKEAREQVKAEQEALARRKEEEKAKKQEEDRLRKDIEKAQNQRKAATPLEEFTNHIANLPQAQQEDLLRRWNHAAHPNERYGLLNAVKAALSGEDVVLSIDDISAKEAEKLKATDITDSVKLKLFLEKKLSPKYEHVRDDVLEKMEVHDEVEQLRLREQMNNAWSEEVRKIKEKAQRTGNYEEAGKSVQRIWNELEAREQKLHREVKTLHQQEDSVPETENRVHDTKEQIVQEKPAEFAQESETVVLQEAAEITAVRDKEIAKRDPETKDSGQVVTEWPVKIKEQKPATVKTKNSENAVEPHKVKGKLYIEPETVLANAKIEDTAQGFELRKQKAEQVFRDVYQELVRNPHHVLLEGLDDTKKTDFLRRMHEAALKGLSDEQKEAIISAHLVGGKDKKSAIYTYDLKDLLEKSRILKHGVQKENGAKEKGKEQEIEDVGDAKKDLFTSEQIRILMEYGITGSPPDMDDEDEGRKRKNKRETPEDFERSAADLRRNQTEDVREDITFEESEDSFGSGYEEIINSEGWNIRNFVGDMQRHIDSLAQQIQRDPSVLRDSTDDIRALETRNQRLHEMGNSVRALRDQLTQLRGGLSDDTPQDQRDKIQQDIQEVERQIQARTNEARTAASELLQIRDRVRNRIDPSEGENTGGGDWGDLDPDAAPHEAHEEGGGSRGRGGKGQLIARAGESQEDRELFGYAKVSSIEDLAGFMEQLDSSFEGRILVSVRDDESGEPLFALNVGKKKESEYLRSTDGNEILKLTQKQWKNKEFVKQRLDLSEEEYNRYVVPKLNKLEEVRVVNPAEFMNWIRAKWVFQHNDNPDDPQNFFTEIRVDHPDMSRMVAAGQIHKDYGTFLRSKFLTDENGRRRVYQKLRDELVNEVWIPSGIRNNEVVYKKVMPADGELYKTYMNTIAGTNLLAKMAGEKSTLATFFSLPEDFEEDFDYLTGRNKKEKSIDTGLGNASLLAYMIYYNISDINGLENLLGEDASIFRRDFITKSTLEAMKESIEDGHPLNYEKARRFLSTPKDTKTIIDDELYDENGYLKRDKESLRRFLTYINPFNPAQKDLPMTAVIRKIVENQMQECSGIRKDESASGFAETFAWLTLYHTGLAARHDPDINARNAQVKYEFVDAYKDKQIGRDAAGNIYNRILKRAVVGMLTGMTTRKGETIIDIFHEAVKKRLKATNEYNRHARQIEAGLSEDQKKQYKEKIEEYLSGEPYEGNGVMAKLLQEISDIQRQKGVQTESEEAGILDAKISRLKDQAILLIAGKDNEEFIQAFKRYSQVDESVDRTLKRLVFDDAQYTQYAAMQYSNGAAMFLEDMDNPDMPAEDIQGKDHEGRRYIKQKAFTDFIQSVEKRMRYMISTWPVPLGAMEERLVNPRDRDGNPPRFENITVAETMFGSEKSEVFKMMQLQIDRRLPKINKERQEQFDAIVKKAEREGRSLTNEEQKQLERLRTIGSFTDKDGNIAEKKEKGYSYDSKIAEERRQNLREVLGFIHYPKDEHGNNLLDENGETIMEYIDPAVDSSDRELVKAYTKVRIAKFLQSHTDHHSPYEIWPVALREAFLAGLLKGRYFSPEDIEDIRAFSDNGWWKNTRREAGRSTWIGLTREGLPKAFKEFFSDLF